jgi:hypothetical protein
MTITTSPNEFVTSLVVDANGYIFSIKDTLDPCRFAFFSDQDGVIYTAKPIQ